MSSVKLRLCNNSGSDGFTSNYQLLQPIDEDDSLIEECNGFNDSDGCFQDGNEFTTSDPDYDENVVTELIYQNQCSSNHMKNFDKLNFDNNDSYVKFNDLKDLSEISVNNISLGKKDKSSDEIKASSSDSADALPSRINMVSSEPILKPPPDRNEGLRTILWAASFSSGDIKRESSGEKSVKFNLEELLKENDSHPLLSQNASPNSRTNNENIIENDVNGNDVHYVEQNFDLNDNCENDYTKSSRSEDEDSNKSGKWDKLENSAIFDASSFFTNENQTSKQAISSIELSSKTEDLSTIHSQQNSTSDFKSDSENHILKLTYNPSNKAPDSDSSSRSMETSGSGSTAFESAMSSSDMMTPFASSKMLYKPNSSQNSQINKVVGINFANLTSENIPGTLNRISAHTTSEKSHQNVNELKKPQIKKSEKDKTHFINANTQDKRLQSNPNKNDNQIKINKYTERKLDKLNLLFLDKKNNFNQSNRKESSLKIINKARETSQFYKDTGLKTASNKTQNVVGSDPTTNPQDKVVEGTYTTKRESDRGSSCSSIKQISETNSKTDIRVQHPIKKNSNNFESNKCKFASKIPIPITKSVRGNRQENICEKSSSIQHELKNIVSMTSKYDKAESVSCSSERSEYSYKKNLSCFKMKADSRKTSSKTSSSNSNFNVIRSKNWPKETNQTRNNIMTSKSFNSNLLKRDDTKVKLQSCPNASPFRNTYGKMVRVKTAPIKSNGLFGDKPNKETSRPDSAWKPGRSSPKLNWFNSSTTRATNERYSTLKST